MGYKKGSAQRPTKEPTKKEIDASRKRMMDRWRERNRKTKKDKKK